MSFGRKSAWTPFQECNEFKTRAKYLPSHTEGCRKWHASFLGRKVCPHQFLLSLSHGPTCLAPIPRTLSILIPPFHEKSFVFVYQAWRQWGFIITIQADSFVSKSHGHQLSEMCVWSKMTCLKLQ